MIIVLDPSDLHLFILSFLMILRHISGVMAHVVYETVEAVDAVVQIKREEDGEVSWSEPTYCTIQPVDESKSNVTSHIESAHDTTSHIEIKPHEDEGTLSGGVDYSETTLSVKNETRIDK